jgi:hypothetical protein
LDEYRREHDWEAYRWMFAEVLLGAYNDILPRRYYEYYMAKALKYGDKGAQKKIKRHHEAIHWFMHERDELCFRVLGIDTLSDKKVMQAISKKFNSEQLFNKFFERDLCGCPEED